MSLLLRIGIGVLLMVHGFAHWYVTSGWKTDQPSSSWLLGAGDAVQPFATLGWGAALLTLLAAGAVTIFWPAGWRAATVAATLVSLAVLALFWRANLWMGVGVDLAVLAALLFLRWPTPEMVGG